LVSAASLWSLPPSHLAGTALVLRVTMAAAVCQHSLKDLVDNFTPGGCYGIEWEMSGGKLKYKTHYNPQWRVDGVNAKGLNGLYTESSKNHEFAVGQGLVGKVFAKQEVLFVNDLQVIDEESVKDSWLCGDGTAFLRAELAKEFDLHSAIFLPLPTGVLEVGSAAYVSSMPTYYAPYVGPATPPLATAPAAAETIEPSKLAPPPFLSKLVEELSSAGCYGIEWVCEGDVMKYRSHYNPQWRMEGIRQQGLKGAYTAKSVGYMFARGEGLVGKAFSEQAVLFVEDVQTVSQDEVKASMQTWISGVGFLRADLAREFGIRSVLFLPSPDGVMEVGSIQTVEDLGTFLSEPAAKAISGKTEAAEILGALKALAR